MSLSSATSAPNGSASLAATLTVSGSVPAGLQWTFLYSPNQISAVTVTAGAALPGANKTLNCAYSSGAINCLVTGLNTNALGSGVVAYLSGTIASAVTSAAVQISNPIASDATGKGMSLTSSGSGSISVPALLPFTCAPATLPAGAKSSCALSLSRPAPAGGLTVTLTSGNSLLSVPTAITIPAGSASASFNATAASSIASNQSGVVTATVGASSQTATISLTPSLIISGLSCASGSLSHGAATTCTVTLNQSAPTGGSLVTVASSSTSLTAPASVTVPAGALSTSFSVTAGSALASNQTATLTAALGSSSQKATINLVAPVVVSSLACSPGSLGQGASGACAVTLTAAAPSGGSAVALASNNALLAVPASVTVTAGATTASFTVTGAATISVNQSALVTATLGTSAQSATIGLTAPVQVTPSFVQESAVMNGNANPAIASLSAASTTGDLIVIAVTQDNQKASVTAITDNKGNVYSRAAAGMNWGSYGTEARSELWYAANITGGGTPVAATVRFSSSPNSFVQLYVSEYSGIATVAPLDQVSSNSAKGSFSGTFASGAKPVASSNELVFGHCEMWSGSVNAGAGFSAHSSFNGNIEETSVVSSVGSFSATCTESGSGPMAMMAIFKATTGAAPAQLSSSLSPSAVSARSQADKKNPEGVLRALSCSPRVAAPGTEVACDLRLSADSGRLSPTLESSNDEVRIPVSVATRPNQSGVSFVARVNTGARQRPAVVTARLGNTEVHDTIDIVGGVGPALSVPGTLRGTAGWPITFTVGGLDQSNLPLHITTSTLPTGATFDSVKGRFEWIPQASQVHDFAIDITATDSAGTQAVVHTAIGIDSGVPNLSGTQASGCSPNSIITLQGSSLAAPGAEVSDTSGGSFDSGGAQVTINGEAAPVLFTSANRLQFRCPASAPGTPLAVSVRTNSGATTSWATVMQSFSPRILSLRHKGGEFIGERDYTLSAHPAQAGDEVEFVFTGVDEGTATPGRMRVSWGDGYGAIDSVESVKGQPGAYTAHARVPAGVDIGNVQVSLGVTTNEGREIRSNEIPAVIEQGRP